MSFDCVLVSPVLCPSQQHVPRDRTSTTIGVEEVGDEVLFDFLVALYVGSPPLEFFYCTTPMCG